MEEWRAVIGYEGFYEVSNTGKVRSVPRVVNAGNQFGCKMLVMRKGKELKPHPRRAHGKNEVGGHLRVSLSKQGRVKRIFVHRIVAQAFIPNPNNYPIVNHKDENPQNNCVDNLEWCDYRHNQNYGTCIQRRVTHTDFKKRAEKQCKKVYQYTLEGVLVKVWNSRKEAEEAGYTGTAITRCANGKRKTHKGYYWSFSAEKRFFGGITQAEQEAVV